MSVSEERKKFAVLGIGRFGWAVATKLHDLGMEVIAIDDGRAVVDAVQDQVTVAIALDATQEALLREQGVDKVDCAVVGIGENFEANVLVTSLLKSFGIPLVITRSYSDLQKRILKNVGATQVVSPEEEIGGRLAMSLVSSSIVDFLELPEGYVVKQIRAPKGIVGKRLADSQIRNRYQIDVIVVRRRRTDPETGTVTDESIVIPDGGEEIRAGDILGVVGKTVDIEKFG